MIFKEVGFRPLYHLVCAFELNDKLRELIKDCPEAAKSSHMVTYGYIDPKKGLMLEVLGGGKQAPKYFYFKEPYEGKRITIPASKVADVEFMYFPDLEPRFKKKFAPRIAMLEKYDASEEVEKSRTFDFLDECREPQYPDDVKVVLFRDGLKNEECWVRITGLEEHCIIGTLLNQPYQDFGINKGESLSFYIHKDDDDKITCLADFNAHTLTKEDLADGSFLKEAIKAFHEEQNEQTFGNVLMVLRSSTVCVPCDMLLTDEAKAVMERLQNDGKDQSEASEEDIEVINKGITFLPMCLESDGHKFMPVFSNAEEIGNDVDAESIVNMPFLNAIKMALDCGDEIEGIVVNAFTEAFSVDKELFGTIGKLDPLFDEGEEGYGGNDNYEHFCNNESGLDIGVGKMDVFNYALYQNDVPPIRGIQVLNVSGDSIDGLSIRITSDYDFFKSYEVGLPSIPSGKPVDLGDPHLVINGSVLASMTETVNATITVELCKDGKVVCGVRGQMAVLAYDQWQGGTSYRDSLAAFVMPNHPAIPPLMHDAADRLSKWNKQSTLEGYQMGDPNRVRDLAAAAYAAIQKKNIVYAEPPASFTVQGQRIRTPETIMEQRLGTCMDMTLLYASLLEAIGLHTLLVMLKGHIFVGIWLKERTFEELGSSDVAIDDIEKLTMRFGNGTDEMTFVECTAMCAGKKVSFEEAEKAAKYDNLSNPDDFMYAIDVQVARGFGVKPLSSRVKNSGEYKIEIEEKKDDELTEAPQSLEISITDYSTAKPRKIANKRELWESKLLDLSTHNMLLNLPRNASIEPIMSSHIDELEDALSDGHEFNLLPVAEWINCITYSKVDENGKPGKEEHWLTEVLKNVGVFEISKWPVGKDYDFNEKFRQEYRSHRLYTYSTEKQLDRELTSIYRAARASQQENGVSSLYLAVGLLRWFVDAEAEEPCYAPLILLPIEIVRKSANQGYALHARDEDPHFNTTLLEMLKQNFNIEIGGLDPLPTDAHGIDIKKVFSLVRSALFTVKNWDVVETCVIGNFSFAQFAMWNDIHTAGEVLDNSNIVRSLMKGHVDWEADKVGDLEDEKVYLPITVDATQLKAIKMAAHGTTFVLHGPPGTGKSQTITGMIANLMAQGKRVLFVAEKMAALSVVQKRLTSLGIGDFCLELHSDKANKKQVLSQLEKALSVKKPSQQSEYKDYLEKVQNSKSKLDGYASHLHKVQTCGMSLRELIALYEIVRNEEKYVKFNSELVGSITADEMKNHLPLIGQLTATGEVVGNISNNPLIGVGVTSYSAELRSQLRRVAEEYKNSLVEAKKMGVTVASILGQKEPETKYDLTTLKDLTRMYLENQNTESMLVSLMNCNLKEILTFFNHNDSLLEYYEYLLNDWSEDFLEMDMNVFLAKHEAAGKKFFGKANAMAMITSEIQSYAKKQISYEQIPALLKLIIEYQIKFSELKKIYNSLSDESRNIIDNYQKRIEFEKAYYAASQCKDQVAKFPGGLDAIMKLAQNSDNTKKFNELQESINVLSEKEEAFNKLLIREANEDAEKWFDEEIDFCDYLIENPASLKDWGLYNQVRQECIKVGIEPVVKAYESDFKANELVGAYKKGLYYALIMNVISNDDVLSCFSGATFNQAIEQFKKLDEAMLDQTKKEIYYQLAERVPSTLDSPEIGKELNLLRKAIGSNARGMSIRTLFERIPNILPRLCSCMLMSPNSVAQYLAQDNNLFDVVIFDEASQLPTCKSVGALSRAKNAVIVGDPKQMPPTSFFAGSGPAVEDLALDDLDSILDDALALGIPSQHLQWHYRSTHESLIAFSNNKFYENKMFTFPSANDRERHVTAVHVEGLYSKSTNVKEAEAVVEEVVRRYNDPSLRGQSIGIVTFNIKQQTLIENLLAKQFQINPELDVWANNGEDPLFVKNLENVQGDERDVILFSIGYGPDEKGHVSNNFGPINKSGGGKRLNVAFSRARVTMTIFSSIYSSDIKVTETSPEGLIAFKDFLKFAEGHDIHTESSEEKQSKYERAGIMQSICEAIKSHGLQYETMVGHSDFHVDIAVVDPYEPTKYMMGIMLDGDGYRQTKNTRDREVAQIGVLKHLGWYLCRVWTIDWWDNRDKELNKLMTVLDTLKDKSRRKHEELVARKDEIKAEEDAREIENARVKAELASQAAEVVAEDEEADNDKNAVKYTVGEETINKSLEDESSVSNDSTDDTEEKAMGEEDIPEVEKAQDNPSNEKSMAQLIARLNDAGGKIVDKRENGGALWIVGGKELSPVIKEFNQFGINFIFKAGGGKATGNKDGWWAKTDVVLVESTKVEVKPQTIVNEMSSQVSERTQELPDEQSTVITDEMGKLENADGRGEVEDKQIGLPTENVEPTPYVYADIAQIPVSTVAEFASPTNKGTIVNVINKIVDIEAPILKETLMRKVFSTFAVIKTNATLEAFEKALKAADTKNAKLKGVVFCWKNDQDPKEYCGIRVGTERSGDEICPQEIRNAICYVLKNKGCLSKDDLIKETSLLFGYKRLGKNLEAALVAGMQFAKSSGAIVSVGGNKFDLPTTETEDIKSSTKVTAQSELKTSAVSIEATYVIPEGSVALYCEGNDYKAAGIQQGANFVVLKGSKINSQTTASCPESVIKGRARYATIIDSNYVMTDDISFTSPSGAASFVAGASKNGYTEWHTEDGTVLKDINQSTGNSRKIKYVEPSGYFPKEILDKYFSDKS